jgi:hypothetical protein
MKKVLATGVGAAALLALTTGNAQAAVMTLEIQNGTFTDGAAFTGYFTYDTTTNTYSNWDFNAPGGLPNAGGVTRSFNYTTTNSSTAASFPSGDLLDNSNSFFSVSALAAYTPNGTAPTRLNYNTMALSFINSLSSLTAVGQGTTLATDSLSANGYASFDGTRNGQNLQQRSVTGGTVLVTKYTPDPVAVPEPLTILGAATAVGFGAAFKRRALKNNKKA